MRETHKQKSNEYDPKWIEIKVNIDKLNISKALQEPVEFLPVEDYVARMTVSDKGSVLFELDANDKEPVKVTKEKDLNVLKNLKIFFDDQCLTYAKDLECLNNIFYDYYP
ncbi:unnamed protein product [Brachionus calyciflorus]|uniref:Uncharacterized protein n=1 Tax=Brachionus calyciflorus TaxID=104777 RepID=A0A814PPP3_9BILA|nr:unnamed protein product [Brachionus calyciflorus]